MKILYVEDELTKNVPKIIRLFEKYLGPKRVKQLEKLENDESGYGAEPQEIKRIVESCGVVDIEYCFTDSLKKIVEFQNEYTIFIIDRNLSEVEYELEDIQKIGTSYKNEFYDKFFEREGDYFLELLISAKFDVINNFYFLTANSRDDLRNADRLKEHFDFGLFKASNIIDKSDNLEMHKLKMRIENDEKLQVLKDNIRYVRILEKIDSDVSENFLDLLTHKDDSNQNTIRKNLTTIRNILSDNILPEIARLKNAPDFCWNPKNKNQIVMRGVISWICNFDKDTRINNFQFNSNAIIKNFLYDIQEIASDYGDHKNYKKKEKTLATSDTVNSLIYALKDIIVWYDKILE
ncbi:MAG: hypothetical protein K9N09_02575 [Candidatus Cloacimonetes bacterium]|nr:hypothetical protein [Candidatus Cloacimonadota bacterium]MCF7813112.1 hypothetical protein [Candidatus Cloacimonadota bacterium]MCF7867560.1 hypothetical protein [Candidatus Cloacimonadota bacterium]MCF7883046.1 hypothetical protein [Candidatus Cloacimonadota bacterium]